MGTEREEFNWATASRTEIDEYLASLDKKERDFLKSLEGPISNLTKPQEGEDFDHIVDQIAKTAPTHNAMMQGVRMFGRRNGELRRGKEKNSNTP